MPTYLDLIQRGARMLERAGVDHPVREARMLIALADNRDTASLIARERDAVSSIGTITRYDDFLSRRASREPYAHISGYRHFFGLNLRTDGRALVPRPESEAVVDVALKMLPRGRGNVVADLGTGSGCLLAAILSERGGLRGIAIDSQPEAAALARENFQRVGVLERVDLHVLPWARWEEWPEVDLIISNPPYIASSVIDDLDPEVASFDPRVALDGGEDGLAAYREIVGIAADRLSAGVAMVLEIGFDQGPAVMSMMEAAGFEDVSVSKDIQGHDRVVAGRSRSAK